MPTLFRDRFRRATARVVTACLLPIAAVAHPGHDDAADDHDPTADFSTDVTTTATPWTHLNFQNDPDNFQFAVVTDRTGGPREGVFEDAVKKLNWLMPEFVLSVGDFIKGNTRNAKTNAAEWDQIMAMVEPLKMPFFFVPGNHDIQMKWLENRVQPEEMLAQWEERFGPTHYSFVYKNVLFVMLFSNDGKEQYISDAQAAYFEQVLAEHPEVRWTFLILHHPLWTYPHESNFGRVEEALQGRRYTVLAGHNHRYVHFDRNNTDYIILASTGGDSRLRGNAFGEFDHVSWFSMTDDGPVMANLRLDGILPKEASKPESVEWVRGLQQSTPVEHAVLFDTDADGRVRSGAAFISFANRSDHPLRIDAEFAHCHQVHPTPGVITRVLPPHTSERIEVKLEVMDTFGADNDGLLELRTVMSLGDVPVDGLEIPGTTAVPLRNHGLDVFETESKVFVGRTELGPRYDTDDAVVRFTLDGSEPTAMSARLDRTVSIDRPTTVKARFFTRDGLVGPVDTLTLRPVPAGPGLLARYYEPDNSRHHVKQMPIFRGLPPLAVERVDGFDASAVARRGEDFAIVFHGMFEAEVAGNYGFHVDSADGAQLLVDGKLIIDDGIKHARHESDGFARLSAGRHPIELHFFQANRDYHLGVEFTAPNGERGPVPIRLLSFDAASEPLLDVPSESDPNADL